MAIDATYCMQIKYKHVICKQYMNAVASLEMH